MHGILDLLRTYDTTEQRRLLAAWGFVANARGNDVLFDADAFGNCLLQVKPASGSPCWKLKAFNKDGPHVLLMPFYFSKRDTWELVSLSATASGLVCEFVNMTCMMEQYEELREAAKFLFTFFPGIWGCMVRHRFFPSPSPHLKPNSVLPAPDSAVWVAMTARQFFVGNVRTPPYAVGISRDFFPAVLALDVGLGKFHTFAFFKTPDKGITSIPHAMTRLPNTTPTPN